MAKQNSTGEDRMKTLKKIARAVVILVFAAIISFCMNDVIRVFADAFLPDSTVTLRTVPNEDGKMRPVTIIRRGVGNEIFGLFENRIVGEGNGNVLDGWQFLEGEAGRAWTRVVADEAGKTLTVTLPENTDRYFAVISDWQSGAFEISVNGGEKHIIDCFADDGRSEYDQDRSSYILEIHPFDYATAWPRKTVYRMVGFAVSTLVWCFVLNELTRNVHLAGEDKRAVTAS